MGNRIVAAMLCVAFLLPNFTGLVGAAGLYSADPQSVQTNSKWATVSDPFTAGEIPAYQTAGRVTPAALVTDCGNGVTRDQAKSYLKMVTGTTDLEFLAFKSAMVSAGFSITASRNLPGSQDYNIYYRFLSPNKNYVVTAYYVAKPGIYPDLSLVYDGEIIDTGFTIQVSQNDSSLQYPSAGTVGSVTVNKQGTTSEKDFLSTGVANIQLSAASIPEEKGVDLIVVLDLSGSMTKEVNADYTLLSGSVAAADHRPDGRTLFSPQAAYANAETVVWFAVVDRGLPTAPDHGYGWGTESKESIAQ